jgi:hypothetical protein
MAAALHLAWRVIVWLWLGLWRLVGLLIFVLLVQRSSIAPTPTLWDRVGAQVGARAFNYLTWEIDALGHKLWHNLYGYQAFISEADRSQLVRDYMRDLSEVQALENQISVLYSTAADVEAATADLRAERDRRRADLAARQGMIESILEGQVAQILIEQGFGIGGQLLPPISARFSRMPNLLIVSPRDAIRFEVSITLNPLSTDGQAALENAIAQKHDVATLIVPLGGIALYPAMILETASIPYALDVIAHEWLHHYLYFHPLGYTYTFNGEGRIINETTASMFGTEISRLALARYYPELVPPPPAPSSANQAAIAPQTPPPPSFDFGRQMHITRVLTDAYLSAGRVTEAERWMELRRLVFVRQGYAIRKINQAYFAFYGGYQAGVTPGIGGTDPIGPALQDIRQRTGSAHAFVLAVQHVTNRAELLSVQATLPND